MKTNFDYLPPEKQKDVRATVERVAAENNLTPAQREDLEFLLGIRSELHQPDQPGDKRGG